MERYIKYKRTVKKVDILELETLFDELITDGWEIINYHEEGNNPTLKGVEFLVRIVVGKRQNNIL